MAAIPKIGDKVRVTTKDREILGVVMPNETDTLVLKLDSGYNVGIDKRKIKKIEIVHKYNPGKEGPIKAAKTKKGLPEIAILHTGGTIASKVDYRTGGVVSRFTPEEILSMFPELKDIANISSKLLFNIWSEDMRFANIKKIARAIMDEATDIVEGKSGAKGVILTMGTDYLHYVSAALAFMLQKMPIPVIIVGAQRSSDRGSSDAAMNLICAAEFIKQSDYKGIAICMHASSEDTECNILHPCKTRKMHTSRRDAFRPINCKPIAKIDYHTRKIIYLQGFDVYDPEVSEMLELEEKVGLLKTYPNMFPEIIDAFKGYKGLVIEGGGLGQMPAASQNQENKLNEKVFDALKRLIKSGCIVVMTSQCIYGGVQMHVYSKGIDLVDAGVIPAKMLSETAFIKLAWILGNYSKKGTKQEIEKVKEMISEDLVGEMFDVIEKDTFLI
ncbi:Glu-tRNA(Gln) amidotransferase subunit GatD [Candidatus Woesearchaeota archaeon]|nr:Glu-tRNA(Gln) amidotransferase subunit GatD [Candidatus Woesearchaeota archaeon]